MKKVKEISVFDQALSKLNPAQLEAVDNIEGPVMVIAGPGTGKTQILTLRIANILKRTDTRPEQVLALTFTESGVKAMRSRLAAFIGVEAYRVPIHTFHSFAGELIRKYPDSYKNIVGGRPASDLEKITLIEELLEAGSYRRLRPHGDHSYYVKPILDAIATMKKENISPDKFATFINQQERDLEQIEKIHEKGAHKGKVRGEYLEAEKFLERNKELLNIYQLYINQLHQGRLFDFEDMILDTIEALENNQEMLFDVQEQYLYILADEHQDVNQSQNRLMELIASYHDKPNIFVVGDEKQAIYRFQGASLDNFLYFSDIYKGAKIITLTSNYRSDQKILDVAHNSIATDDPLLKDLRVPLQAEQKLSVIVSQQNFSHSAIEDSWVVQQIVNHQKSGVPYDEMAIIVRTNREVEKFSKLLRKENIPTLPSADGDVLEHPITLQIINLIKVVIEPKNEQALAELLHAPYLGIPTPDLVTFLSARNIGTRLFDLIESEARLSEIGIKEVFAFNKFINLLKMARQYQITKNPAEVTEYLLRESGFIDYVIKQDTFESIRIIRRLYDELESMFIKGEIKNLTSFLKYLDTCQKYKIPLLAPYVGTTAKAVNVMTAHKSKGLEFEVVIIPHLTDNVWGANQRPNLFKLPVVKHTADSKSLIEDDERRLFYVSMTRAKRVLQFSFSNQNNDGRELVLSRFLVALEGNKITEESTTNFEDNFRPLDSIKKVCAPSLDTDFLRLSLSKRGWSATSFNNYSKSPWEYIYKNALRIPTIKTPELQFGSSVHAVLEKIIRHFNEEGKMPKETAINDWLKNILSVNSVTLEEFTRQHERGLKAVLAYLPVLQKSLTTTMRTEYSIKALLKTGIEDFPEVLLTGNFDRLDYDEQGRVVKVVDYKTGKTKTRGEIEGTTKNSQGNYKRQLVFYALLLSLQPDEKFRCTNGVLSFVEPDSKGNIHEEVFNITKEEISNLKSEIIEATQQIVSGDCLQTVCDSENCSFCHLVELLNK